MTQASVRSAAFTASLPVLFGYVPLGIAFGLLFTTLDYPWYFATLMGLVIFAGAAQFLAVGLLAAHAGLLEIFVATLVLNSRHLFYGLSMISRFTNRGLGRLYLIFGLTDETYSLLTGTRSPEPGQETAYYLWVTALNQGYWVLGCTLGALMGARLDLAVAGIEFALVALFVVLLVEQVLAVRRWMPFLIALVSGGVALLLFDQDNMLLLSILMATSLLLLQRKVGTWTRSSI